MTAINTTKPDEQRGLGVRSKEREKTLYREEKYRANNYATPPSPNSATVGVRESTKGLYRSDNYRRLA